MKICISAHHTDAGKTHLSSMLCASLGYDYFKIIQAGEPRDALLVKHYCQLAQSKSIIYPDGIFLKTPASPHIGKKLENKTYNGLDIPLPESKNLIIETAGGLYTPIDEHHTMLDFMGKNNLPTLLVGRYYLGSINHILLSIEALRARGIKILGLVISGEGDEDFDSFISSYADIKILHLQTFDQDNFHTVKKDFLSQLKRAIKSL